jgi:lysophospholipase L1-like esterase
VYRDASTIDPASPPPALATLGVDIVEYIDSDVVIDQTYFYRVSAVSGANEVFSDEVSLTAGSGSPVFFPTIPDDNIIYEEDVTVAESWSAYVTSDGTHQTYTPDGSSSSNVSKSISGPSSGDYILYTTLRADSIAASNAFNLALGGVGSEAFIISLGYNRKTSAYEQNRVSVRFGASNGVQGPLIDYSASDIEIAIHYDARVGVGNLWVKESGRWEFYGGAAVSNPYKSEIRYGSGGGFDMTATIKEFFIAHPNLVAIGDSVTAGHPAFDPSPSYYAGDDDSDSTWMSHALVYPGLRNNLVVNYGVGGENTGQIAARVGAMLANTTPRVVFLSACNNDFNDSISLSTRTNNIQTSVNEIMNDGAAVILYNAIYPNSSASNFPAQRDFYKDWWDNYSQTLTSVDRYIDINEAVKDPAGGGEIDSSMTSDGVHPNISGYGAIGNYISAL